MSTCKDCIHAEVCPDKDNVVRPCYFFKDRAKFVELTCKVGDIVYCLDRDNNIVRETINSIRIYDTGIVYFANYTFAKKDFGDIIFLTYEEAEKALKEQPND